MIQATDIRIGNIVFDEDKNTAIITGFAPFGHSTRCDEAEGCNVLFDIVFQDKTKSKNWTCPISDLSPIHITEERLLKCDWGGYKPMHFNSNFEIDAKGHIWYCGHFTGTIIKYLHELQNAFKLFTGNELNINL